MRAWAVEIQLQCMSKNTILYSKCLPTWYYVEKSIQSIKLAKAGILVIGNESKGIRSPLFELITDPITIPKYGAAESLNAAVATGIILAKWQH